MQAFDGEQESRDDPAYLAGYELGETALDQLLPREWPFLQDEDDS
jgi:hypothetical protein